jgi:hypothetical protein
MVRLVNNTNNDNSWLSSPAGVSGVTETILILGRPITPVVVTAGPFQNCNTPLGCPLNAGRPPPAGRPRTAWAVLELLAALQSPAVIQSTIIGPVSGIHGQFLCAGGKYPNGVIYVEGQSTHVGRNITK